MISRRQKELYTKFLSLDLMAERTMPVCFTKEQLKLIEKYAKSRGMVNLSQAVEDVIKNSE